jgi:DNA-binding HxlR family transcriptional regulator
MRKMEAEDIERVIIQALNHDERRTILRIIRAQEKGSTYSEILGELGVPTGTLNYHLKQLEGLIERDNERRYHLTPLGERALSVLLSMTEEMGEGLEDYLRATSTSQSGSVHPTVVGLIYLGIVFDCLFIAIWGYTGYVSIVLGGPTFVLALVVILISLGLIILYGLVRALKTAPSYVRKIERKLGVT